MQHILHNTLLAALMTSKALANDEQGDCKT